MYNVHGLNKEKEIMEKIHVVYPDAYINEGHFDSSDKMVAMIIARYKKMKMFV